MGTGSAYGTRTSCIKIGVYIVVGASAVTHVALTCKDPTNYITRIVNAMSSDVTYISLTVNNILLWSSFLYKGVDVPFN